MEVQDELKSNGDAAVIPQPHGGALKPWPKGQSGNPAGKKPGTKHISTWIQELLNDPDFTSKNFMFSGKDFKGAPLQAIILTAVAQSLSGDKGWAEWLAKYGYGQKLDITTGGDKLRPATIIDLGAMADVSDKRETEPSSGSDTIS